MKCRTLAVLFVVASLGCTTVGYREPFAAKTVTPGSGEKVQVDHSLVIFDSSASVESETLFPEGKALYESFVAGMPAGNYQAGAIAFGGSQRKNTPLAGFDRSRLSQSASDTDYFGNSTPLRDVLLEAADDLSGKSGRAAVVIFSDGAANVLGTPQDPSRVVEAGQQLVSGYQGQVCIHAVQIGNDPAGGEVLNQLAALSNCGSVRPASSVNNQGGLYAFERDVYLGAAPAPRRVAAPKPGDADGDGVLDPNDRCPGTPRGAPVDGRGCWVLKGITFATNSAEISSAGRQELDQIQSVMAQEAGLRLRIEGHTDSMGAAAYNQQLSERRAASVVSYLTQAGVDATRLDSVGYGEERPAAANDTAEGRATNRRIEVSVAN